MKISMTFHAADVRERLALTGVTKVEEWSCLCGCDLKVYFGWGDGRGSTHGLTERDRVFWAAPSHAMCVADSVEEVERQVAEHGQPIPLRGALTREGLESLAKEITGGNETHTLRTLVAAFRALFPKVVRA